jgi:hypothetical protein
MIVPIEFDKIKIADEVFLMSKKGGFLALGVVVIVSQKAQQALVRITSLDTAAIKIRSRVLRKNPFGNKYLKIGSKLWFTKEEIFQVQGKQ